MENVDLITTLSYLMGNVYLIIALSYLAFISLIVLVPKLCGWLFGWLFGRKRKEALKLVRSQESLLRLYCLSTKRDELEMAIILDKNIRASKKEFGFNWPEIGVSDSTLGIFCQMANTRINVIRYGIQQTPSIQKPHVSERDRCNLNTDYPEISIEIDLGSEVDQVGEPTSVVDVNNTNTIELCGPIGIVPNTDDSRSVQIERLKSSIATPPPLSIVPKASKEISEIIIISDDNPDDEEVENEYVPKKKANFDEALEKMLSAIPN